MNRLIKCQETGPWKLKMKSSYKLRAALDDSALGCETWKKKRKEEAKRKMAHRRTQKYLNFIGKKASLASVTVHHYTS